MAISANKSSIGILGGTFDPVHIGHLRCALEVQTALQLDQVRLLPCKVPVHRPATQANAEQRQQLIRASIAAEPRLALDSRELDRDSPSYMVASLESLRAELGADCRLALILGMDAFAGLHLWHRWTELLSLSNLILLDRPGASPPEHPELQALLAQHQIQHSSLCHAAGGIYRVAIPALDISATQIRRLLAQGGSARYLVTDAALALLHSQNWYRNG